MYFSDLNGVPFRGVFSMSLHNADSSQESSPDESPKSADSGSAIDISQLAPLQQAAADHFEFHARGSAAKPEGGWIERVFLIAPNTFDEALRPTLQAARKVVLANDSHALTWQGSASELERAIHIAKQTLARRIALPHPVLAPFLAWHDGELVVGVPAVIPGADNRAAVRVWLSATRETAFARAERVRDVAGVCRGELASWIATAESWGIAATVWRCALPSSCESAYPLAVEVAPNPTGFLNAMFIAHRGSAAIVVGSATGVGGVCPPADEPRPRTRLLPSGWNYLKPDRSSGSSEPIFPNGARQPAHAVFVPHEAVFLACARATWAASLEDAWRVAFAA